MTSLTIRRYDFNTDNCRRRTEINQEELKNKFGFSDEQVSKISYDDLAMISGGTTEELSRMALTLHFNDFGNFLSVEEGHVNCVDVAKMKAFFAEKGYRYEPGIGDEQQDIYWKDGLPYGSDYITDLIENGKF